MRPTTMAELDVEVIAALAAGDDELALSLAADMDALAPQRPAVSTLGAALWYAEANLWVFPLSGGSKKPYKGSRGLLEATNDPASVRGLFGEYPPDSNVGIATGHEVDVIDIDGPVGMKSYAEHLLDDDGMWLPRYPVLGMVSTPRPGGKHIYVPAEPGQGNRTDMLPGIDYRGEGGYVVAPPSTTAQGRYIWTRPLDVS